MDAQVAVLGSDDETAAACCPLVCYHQYIANVPGLKKRRHTPSSAIIKKASRSSQTGGISPW